MLPGRNAPLADSFASPAHDRIGFEVLNPVGWFDVMANQYPFKTPIHSPDFSQVAH